MGPNPGFNADRRRRGWFHDHALELEPALYGVRLSFALAYWVDLAQEYPAARTSLGAIRDRKVQMLLSGQRNRETFHDVASINYYLADEPLTAQVFAKLDRADFTFANQCVDAALPAWLVLNCLNWRLDTYPTRFG